MKVGEAMKSAMRERKVTQAQIGKVMGVYQANVSRALKEGSGQIDFWIEMAEVLGYEIVIQPKGAGKRKEGSYVLTVEREVKPGEGDN